MNDARRLATPLWMWAALIALALALFGAVAVHAAFYAYPWQVARLPIAPSLHWGWSIRYEWTLPIGVVSLAAPFLALAALILKRARGLALTILALCALAQTALLALEYHWKQQERVGRFARPNPWEQWP